MIIGIAQYGKVVLLVFLVGGLGGMVLQVPSALQGSRQQAFPHHAAV